jgi:hypothetical protein
VISTGQPRPSPALRDVTRAELRRLSPRLVRHSGVAMVSTYRARFDYIVLKPIFFALLYWVGYSLYDKAWLMALFYVVMMLALGFVGAALHKTLSVRELVTRNYDPSLSDAELPSDPALSREDSGAIAKSSIGVSFIIGVIASVLASHTHGWLFSVLLGVGIWWLGTLVVGMIFGLVASQYAVGRLRSILPGLILFWLGVCAIVVPVIFVIRAFSS